MLGAIIGDIVGSRFERRNYKQKDFELWHPDCRFTDDTVLTVAVAETLLEEQQYAPTFRYWGNRFVAVGYGKTFRKWLRSPEMGPYNSWGNGSAMRVSPVGWLLDDEETVRSEARRSAEVTHNHPEGIKGAQAVALAIFWARQDLSREELRQRIESHFAYDLQRSLDDIRPDYEFDVSCQGSVPEAIIAFLESEDFEDSLRNAISIGGDSDTIAAIAGSIAEAYYGGIPEQLKQDVMRYLPAEMRKVYQDFEMALGNVDS